METAAKKQKPKVKLDKWTLGRHPDDPEGTLCLFGYTTGHPTVREGRPAVTSQIITVDLINKVAETKNTVYELGEQSEEVKDYFDNRMADYDKMLKELANALNAEGGRVFDAIGEEIPPDEDNKQS